MHQLYVDAEYHFLDNLFVGVSSATLSKTYIDGANIESEVAAGYMLIGARVGYKFYLNSFNAEITLQGRNLTDQKYVAFTEPDPGGNAYQPGAGREFFINAKIEL
jgi:iron complex outermembrane recepter protein